MDKKYNYNVPLRAHATAKATTDYGASRPRMNTIFNKEADCQFKEGNGSETTADEAD